MKTTPARPPGVRENRPIPNLLRIRLGAALQNHRLTAGLTQGELAKRADLSLKYVGEIERGEANTTLDVLERLAAVVNWNLLDVFDGLREPISEGVRVFLIEMLRGFVQALHQAIGWLEALDPKRNRAVVPSSGSDIVASTWGGAGQGNTKRPRLQKWASGRKV